MLLDYIMCIASDANYCYRWSSVVGCCVSRLSVCVGHVHEPCKNGNAVWGSDSGGSKEPH